MQTFPLGSKFTVSSGGGDYPLWSADGKELFYLTSDGKVMSAKVKSESPFQTEAPQQLFQTSLRLSGYPFAVTRDGSRFLLNTPTDAPNSTPLTIVLNWAAGLNQAK